MYQEVAKQVYRRAAFVASENKETIQLPGWAFGLFFLDAILFLPIFLVVGYTLHNVYPVLAMVEDPSPPAYEPVSLNADTDSLAEEAAPVVDESARGSQQTRAISSSFRGVHRVLYGVAGWRSYFRGIAAWLALSFASIFVFFIVSTVPFVPAIVAAMISAITLSHLYTAWTHIVISTPSEKPFYQRLPPFKTAFRATALPTVVYFVALEIHSLVPKFFARLMNMNMPDYSRPQEVPVFTGNDIWKGLIVTIISLTLTVFLTIPAHVVLTRVQASLLPEEDETIVPFDRSFQGKVEPAIVGGQGFVSMKDAWQTFSRASWVRLVKLYLKIFAASLVVYLAMLVIIVPEALLIMRSSSKIQ